MKKILLICFLMLSALFADSSLGVPLTPTHLKPAQETKSYQKHLNDTPTKTFRKDDHRYNKRYRDFDYERRGYYDEEGYYYGYYNTEGYFYNNIFFTYNSEYTYHDRDHFRGRFRPQYRHHRRYEYHRINDWNRVHHYREPHTVVYGYYYDSPSYSHHYEEYRSSDYYHSPRYDDRHRRVHDYPNDHARIPNYRETHYQRENRYRYENHHRRERETYPRRRGDARMRTRNSSHREPQIRERKHHFNDKTRHHSPAHMQLSS